ncbi:MAG: hypothetical protein M2R45_02851 [Verrucomicrobia subdivision 3 bacterium]|nr:hypothetical protein [Limisphaerales bacterium]MCS1415446.1 hypothetical protein [Limisphaerales bacterium]
MQNGLTAQVKWIKVNSPEIRLNSSSSSTDGFQSEGFEAA